MDEYEKNADGPDGTIRQMAWVIFGAIVLVGIASLLTYWGMP